jgi:hypothetical protein
MYRGTWQEKLFEFFKGSFSGKPAEEKQTGGFITGIGGPKDDRVPIMASPGEFMLKASSAQKLGKPTLNYMNQTGALPGFADGGPLMTPGALMHKRWMEKPEEYRTAETPFQKLMPKLSKGLVEKAPWLPLGEHVPEWAKNHPQLYGMFGAAKTFTPYHEAEMAVGGSELGLLSLAILPFLGIGQKLLKGAYTGAKFGGKSLLKLFGKSKAKDISKKPITKSTLTGKYEEEIYGMLKGIGTEGGGTNIGKAIGAKATEGDIKILGTLARAGKRIKSEFKIAKKPDMTNAEFNEVIKLGSQVQAVREGQEFAKVILAIKSGKTPPITSATEKAIQYVKEGGLDNIPKINFASIKSKSALMSKLTEETGLGPPGGALQMVMESAVAAVKKPKKFAPISKLEMESYAKKSTGRGIPERAFETILERKTKASQEEIEMMRKQWNRNKNIPIGAFETILETKSLSDLEHAVKVVSDVVHTGGTALSKTLHTTAREILYETPQKLGILKQIPKGARALRGEAELGKTAIVLDIPGSKVMRIGDKTQPRLNIPEMLQVESRKEFGDYQVEVMPRVVGIGTATKEQTNMLKTAVKARGESVGKKYDFWDIHADNIGFVGKNPIVIDPGAINYRKGGAIISSYSQGTPYVPQTQLAVVHQGEAIIPAEYNAGGFIGAPKFQAGGAVNPLKAIVGVGEEIGEAIVKKIEEASIKAPEIPPLEIGNLDELQSILGEGAVGAERGQSKLDQFVTKVDDELRRFDDELVSTFEKVTVLELDIQRKVDGDIRELKTTVVELDRKVSDIYTQSDRDVDLAAEKSELEAKLIEGMDELKNLDLTPMKSSISLLRNDLNNAIREIYELEDKVAANINLNGLR